MKTKKTQTERGQSFTELALMFVTLMLILSALIDFGRMLYSYMSLVDSAQEGVLYLSLAPTDVSGTTSRVRDSTTFPADIADPAVTSVSVIYHSGKISTADHCAGELVTVNVAYAYAFTMPFINMIFPTNSFNLLASATGPILTPFCA